MKHVEISGESGCLGLFVAVAFASLLITLSFGTPFWLGIYIAVFVVTTIIGCTVGLLLYWAVQYRRAANIWTAMAVGAITGSFFPFLIAISERNPASWLVPIGFGLAGTAGGLIFYLTATASEAPRRKALAMFIMAAASIAAALLIWPRLQ